MANEKLTDEDVEKVGWALENETEGCMTLALQTIIMLLMDIRNQKKVQQKVYKVPTNDPNDIIVGLAGKGIINKDEFEGLIEVQKCDNCSDCTCNEEPEDDCQANGGYRGITLVEGYDPGIKLRSAENTDGYETIKESDECGKKSLKDLTDKEKTILKSMGMYWELYPEAVE